MNHTSITIKMITKVLSFLLLSSNMNVALCRLNEKNNTTNHRFGQETISLTHKCTYGKIDTGNCQKCQRCKKNDHCVDSNGEHTPDMKCMRRKVTEKVPGCVGLGTSGKQIQIITLAVFFFRACRKYLPCPD